MIKIFFATFFIAELIIALAIISKIRQFDKRVRKLNTIVCDNQFKIKIFLIDIKIMLEDFSRNVQRAKGFLREKRKEYTLRAVKTITIYLSILFLKGKYKKTILGYQLIKEILAGIADAYI